MDGQIVSEQSDLGRAYKKKTDYYSEPSIVEAVRVKHGVRTVVVTSATLSWKGVWSADSSRELKQLGFVSGRDLAVISTRVLVEDVAAYRIFNATTSVDYCAGVG